MKGFDFKVNNNLGMQSVQFVPKLNPQSPKFFNELAQLQKILKCFLYQSKGFTEASEFCGKIFSALFNSMYLRYFMYSALIGSVLMSINYLIKFILRLEPRFFVECGIFSMDGDNDMYSSHFYSRGARQRYSPPGFNRIFLTL